MGFCPWELRRQETEFLRVKGGFLKHRQMAIKRLGKKTQIYKDLFSPGFMSCLTLDFEPHGVFLYHKHICKDVIKPHVSFRYLSCKNAWCKVVDTPFLLTN